ncbi:hypothetical protein Hanom_Chr10g00887111 [Helianthus anomalus]
MEACGGGKPGWAGSDDDHHCFFNAGSHLRQRLVGDCDMFYTYMYMYVSWYCKWPSVYMCILHAIRYYICKLHVKPSSFDYTLI